MPDSPPPDVTANAADGRPEALTPEAVEAVLADFRSWLAEAAVPAAEAPPTDPEAEPVDLHTLLAQFVALRHEVNLQTRAARAQQEQNAETLARLADAVRAVDGARQPAPDGEDRVRPLLKTLMDLYDALALARRELQRVQETVLPVLAALARPEPAAPAPRRSFLARLFGRSPVDAPAEARPPEQTAEAAVKVRGFLDSVITGYTMSLQRLERALRQHGLEAIPCEGRPFDPERMEVLEVVADSGRPANEVLDEVRRGYLWNGRVFRYAQVRVAKSWPQAAP
jgi:molecular chaperone GrpE